MGSARPKASVAILAAGLVACSARARDVAGERYLLPAGTEGTPSATASAAPPPTAPRVSATPRPVGTISRFLVRANVRAMASDAENLYYGDSNEDAVFSLSKKGDAAPVRIARRAPTSGALVLDGGILSWVGSPGDVVFHTSTRGEGTEAIRDRGIFTDVAAQAGDVFIAEALGAGGAILRVTAGNTTRLAALDASPRALLVETDAVYVTTPTKILRIRRTGGDAEVLATGIAIENPQMDDTFVYAVMAGKGPDGRVVARVPKTGGELTVVARDVHDAPIEIQGGELLYVGESRTELRAVPTRGGPVRVLSQDDALSSTSAVVADDSTVYVATGAREDAAIVAIARR